MHITAWAARMRSQREQRKRKCTALAKYSTATYVNVTKKEIAAISAFGRLISLFKYSAEEEARICDGGGWGEEEEGGAEWLRV